MNTDLSKCEKQSGRGFMDMIKSPDGIVPCLTFYEVIMACILLGIAIYFTYRYILKRNAVEQY